MARRASLDVNLASIAKHLKVSISTVSRALRDAEGIHPDTRRRVLEAAGSMGYQPSRAAEVESSARAHYVMALAQSSSPSSDQRYLAGISRASIALNLTILSHHVAAAECASVLDPRWVPAAMKTGLVEGLVLIHRWPEEVAARLSEKWPMVSIVHHYPDTAIDLVGIDDRTSIFALVKHLRQSGHERIGFFGFCREMSWSCARFSAYVEALIHLGLEYEPRQVVEVSLENMLAPGVFSAGGWTTPVFKGIDAGVHAWICASTATGHTLCRTLLERGVRIPEEVAVTGYHRDLSEPGNLPVLTSTDVADEELGAAALRRLLHRFEHPEETQRSILLPARFFQGGTTQSAGEEHPEPAARRKDPAAI